MSKPRRLPLGTKAAAADVKAFAPTFLDNGFQAYVEAFLQDAIEDPKKALKTKNENIALAKAAAKKIYNDVVDALTWTADADKMAEVAAEIAKWAQAEMLKVVSQGHPTSVPNKIEYKAPL